MSQTTPTQTECATYAEHFILTGDKSKAWRATFPNSKAQQKAVAVNATRFHNIPSVSLMIDELRGKVESEAKDRALYSIEDKKRILLDIATFGSSIELAGIGRAEEDEVIERQRNPSAAVAAIKELNLMDGDHAAKQLKIEASDSFEDYASRRGK